MFQNKQNQINNPGLLTQAKKYVKYWHFFALGLILSLTAAWLYLQTTVPKYKITSTLLVQDDSKGDGLLKGTAFSDLDMFRTAKTVNDEMEVMRSRDLIYGVLKDLNLGVSYAYKLPLTTQELYGKSLPVTVIPNKLSDSAYSQKLSLKIISKDQFILKENEKKTIHHFGAQITRPHFKMKVVKGPAFKVSDQELQVGFVNLQKLAQSYSTIGLTVLPVIKDANTVVLSLLDAIPQRGIDILNELISRYNMANVNNKNQMALNTIKFIDGKLKFLTKNLSGVEQDVENYKKDNRITELSADAQMSLQSSGDYSQQLSATEVQLGLVQSLISYLKGAGSSFELVPSTLGLKDPTLQSLTDKYNNLQIERQRLLRNNSESNPLVVNLTEQLTSLKGNLLENLTMIRRGLSLERNKLSSKTSQFDSRLSHVPVMERGLLERSREQSVKNNLYQYLLQKREETELSLSATIPTSQVIDKPAYDPVPAQPKTQLIYMLSMMAGLTVPFSMIYLKDKLNHKVKDIYDVEYIATNGKILGELSHKGIGESIVVHKNGSNTISELFRYIRSNLHFMDMNRHNKVLLVTSTTKGEGKTFFSINLGITLSLVKKRVVILEFDLRKPDLLNHMKLKAGSGLSDYLQSENIRLEDMLIKAPQSDHLYVIGCGQIPGNPSEILMNPRLKDLFATLREEFDYVIVDTSPVGHVADAFTLAEFADSSIYLVRYNHTNKEDLAIFEEICENGRLKNPLVVFNDAGKGNKNAHRYGRYAYSA